MSNDSAFTTLEQIIVARYSSATIYNYTLVSAAALVLYDYFLTFPLEHSQIWHGKLNLTKPLFVLNRYFSLVYLYTSVFSTFYKPATDMISGTLLTFALISIFTLRTYAIYGKNRVVLSVLAFLGLSTVGLDIWPNFAQTASAYPLQLQIGPNTCDYTNSSTLFPGHRTTHTNIPNLTPTLPRTTVQLTALVSNVVFDATVVVLTVYRTGRLAIRSREANIKGSLSFILLRDGTIYYAATFMPTFVTVALQAVGLKTGSPTINFIINDLIFISDALQIVSVNRLVLNLSHAANRDHVIIDARENTEFRSRTGLEPPVFASGSVLGNVGAGVRTVSVLDDVDLEADAEMGEVGNGHGFPGSERDSGSEVSNSCQVERVQGAVQGDTSGSPEGSYEDLCASARLDISTNVCSISAIEIEEINV